MEIRNKIFIFDFDGTIADTFSQTIMIANRLAIEFNFQPIKTEDIKELKHKSVIEVIRFLKISPFKVPAIVARAREELHKDIMHIKPFDGLHEVLKHLKGLGHLIGIVSSNSTENIISFLTKHQLDLFDFLHTSPRIWGKNQGLNQLIKNHNLSTEQIIYVGDETRDIEAAHKVGIRVAAVTWGYNSEKALKSHNPDFIVNLPQEFLTI